MPKSPLTGQGPRTRPALLSRGALRAVATLAAGALLGVTAGSAARADDVYNTIDGTTAATAIDVAAEIMPLAHGGDPGTTTLRIQARHDDGFTGCNTNKGPVTFAVHSSDTNVATVEPSTVEFTACTPLNGPVQEKQLIVRPVGAGSAFVTLSVIKNPSPGSFDTVPANFRVDVAPPPNSPPTIEVIGVTGGAHYFKGVDVPTPMCRVTDAEDGTKEFSPALSRPAPQLPDGLGERHARCTYTDSRGTTAASSASWFIDDPDAPVVRYIMSKPTPANGWYREEVALEWIVTEPQSPGTLRTEGCDRVWITADQKPTTFTCTATSAGGKTTLTSAAISKDGTAPVVTGTIETPGIVVGDRTWYAQVPTISWSAEDSVSDVLEGSVRPTVKVLGEGRNQMARTVATDNAGNTGGTSLQYINVDLGAPVVRAELAGTPAYDDGTTAWFKDEAKVDVTASDPDVQPFERGSGLAINPTGSHTVTATGDFSITATDNVGHVGTSNTVPVQVDATAPTTSVTCPKLPWVKGVPLTTTWTATDEAGGSGLATPAKGTLSLDTKAIGQRTATAPAATDNVGHTGEAATCGYRVIYPFLGFLDPIDDGGVYNKVKAGSAVPVKFSLLGNQGMDILSGAPMASQVPCSAKARTDSLEHTESAKSTSGLKYDAKTRLYTYVWKTPASYAGTCQKLTVTLADGMSYSALFTFTR